MTARGTLHHLELWVADFDIAKATLGWLFQQLGYTNDRLWPWGGSWRLGTTYIVLESGPDVHSTEHDRLRPGLNHLAFHAGTQTEVDQLTAEAQNHGWTVLFPHKHPYAGGTDHYAAYLVNSTGFEVELVADPRVVSSAL